MARHTATGEEGYTLVACLVIISILLIGLMVATQVWSHYLKRVDEEELIFRGTRYVNALRIYRTRYGHYPTKLEDLMKKGPGKPRCIRRLWEDPITKSDKWGIIYSTGMKWPVQPLPEGEKEKPGQGATPSGGLHQLQSSDMTFSPIGGEGEEGGGAPVGPIAGVFCTSTDESIREYNGRRHYNEWEFSLIQGRGRRGMGGRPGGEGIPRPPGSGGRQNPGLGGGKRGP